MPGNTWYPYSLASLGEWHANFAFQASRTGESFGLTPEDVAQIVLDAANVNIAVNGGNAAESYKKAVNRWRDALLDGDNSVVPVNPSLIALPALPDGSKNGIRLRTLGYAATIKASPSYSNVAGVAYQITGPRSSEPPNPTVRATAQPASVVRLRIVRKGYTLVAVDCRRGGGEWEFIGVSMTSTYLDRRPPLVAGQPEVREYRVQGMKHNARVGGLSQHGSIVTMP